jgi:ubiquinone/menaquinone biosynthesis C-methylase UbiE
MTEPSRRQIGIQNRLEREKAKNREKETNQLGSDFWTDYLAHFHSIGECPDYLKLLDHVSRILGPVTPGTTILDAGCGNGHFGMFFLLTHLQSSLQEKGTGGRPTRYIGVDFVTQALKQAQTNLARTIEGIHEKTSQDSADQHSVQTSLGQVDLNHPLPFQNNQFDRIVCNLVIGYLKNPQFTLGELFRVLAPGGKMVITNLKPEGDFSGIYQNLVEHTKSHDELKDARELLGNYGKIKFAEKEGQFQFFEKGQWIKAVQAIGASTPSIYPTFANQAFLVVIEKPGSPLELTAPDEASNKPFFPYVFPGIEFQLVA